MKDINIVLGKRVTLLRKNLRMTREKLAEKIDVSPRFLADVESGKAGVSLNTLKNLCVALSTPADYLLALNDGEDLPNQIALCTAKLDAKYYPLLLAILNELLSLQGSD